VAAPLAREGRPLLGVRPPFAALFLLGAAWSLEAIARAVPVVPWPWRWAGLLPLLAGVAVGGAALLRFRAHGTTHDPHGLPSALVTTGPYRLSRNPMYLGLLLGLLGVGVLRGTVPFLAVPPLLFLVLRARYVPYEEARMARRFGDAYLDWKSRTRRWL
jgi:protein-S-isoprenylcysteine O-methyltransferase Ste14